MKKLLSVIVPVLLVSIVFAAAGSKQRAQIAALVERAGVTKGTKNQQAQVWQDQFNKHVTGISLQASQVWMASDGYFRIQTSFGEASAKFLLKPGDVFYGPPDHHATVNFRLKEIEPDGAIIEYESKFDHRSFGKNLITVVKGTFKVLLK